MRNPRYELNAARMLGLPTGPLERPLTYLATKTGNYHTHRRCSVVPDPVARRLGEVRVPIKDLNVSRLCKRCARNLPGDAGAYAQWLCTCRSIIGLLNADGTDPGLPGAASGFVRPEVPPDSDSHAARLLAAAAIADRLAVPTGDFDNAPALEVTAHLARLTRVAAAAACERVRHRPDNPIRPEWTTELVAFRWTPRLLPDIGVLAADKALVYCDLVTGPEDNLVFALGNTAQVAWLNPVRLGPAQPGDDLAVLATARRLTLGSPQFRANNWEVGAFEELFHTSLEMARLIHQPAGAGAGH